MVLQIPGGRVQYRPLYEDGGQFMDKIIIFDTPTTIAFKLIPCANKIVAIICGEMQIVRFWRLVQTLIVFPILPHHIAFPVIAAVVPIRSVFEAIINTLYSGVLGLCNIDGLTHDLF